VKIERILVPVDFSPQSAAAVERAIELATAYNAGIDLLHSYHVTPGGIVPYGPVFPETLLETLRVASSERLRAVHEQIRSAGVEANMHLSAQLPSMAIIDAAEQLSADLIVMGTRGLTGLKHVLLGSVAETVARLAPCPVMTVGAAEKTG
jgi:nucleotide-binding universal stress UspA family protein